MMQIVSLIALPVLILSAGMFLSLASLEKEKAKDVFLSEFIVIGTVTGIVLYGLTVLILATLKVLTLSNCLLALSVMTICFLIINRRLDHFGLVFKPLDKKHTLILCLILALSSIYLAGAESILDGRDNGMYAFSAGAMVEQKSQVWTWDNLITLKKYLPANSFYTELSPLSFYHDSFSATNNGADFYPAVLTLAYFLYNLDGLSWMYTFIGVVNLFLVFYVTLRFFDGNFKIALLCVFLYAINMAVISTARLGLTEVFSNALLSSVILLILNKADDDKAGVPLFGLLLIAAFLTHPANYFFLVPLSFLFAAKSYDTSHRAILVSTLALAVIVSLLYYYHFDVSYISALSSIVILMILISISIIAMGALARYLDKRQQIKNYAMELNRSAYYAFAAVLVLGCIYSYFIGPHYDIINEILKLITAKSSVQFYDTERARYVFYRFGFYVTVFGIFGGVSGYLLWKWKNLGRIDLPKLATILGFAIFSAIFLLTTTPHDWHFFTARRYVVLVMLGFLMFFSFLIFYVYQQGRMYLKICAVILAGLYIYNAFNVVKPFVFFRELKGNNKFITELSNLLPNKQPVLTVECGSIVPVLEFVYHKNIVPVTALDISSIDALITKFNTVSVILCSSGDNAVDLMVPSLGRHNVKLVSNYVHLMPGSEQVREAVPRTTVRHRYNYKLLEIYDADGTHEFDVLRNAAWRGLYSDGWTKGVFSANLPPISDPAGSYGLAVDFTRPGDVDGSVAIFVNGKKLKTVPCRSNCKLDISIPRAYLNMTSSSVGNEDKSNNFVFRSNRGIIPKKRGINTDERELHFQIEKCIFYNVR